MYHIVLCTESGLLMYNSDSCPDFEAILQATNVLINENWLQAAGVQEPPRRSTTRQAYTARNGIAGAMDQYALLTGVQHAVEDASAKKYLEMALE